MKWVPLHTHSQYSILDATASLEAIAKQAEQFLWRQLLSQITATYSVP